LIKIKYKIDYQNKEVSQVSYEDKQRIRHFFELVDKNGNGQLSESEVVVDFKLLLKDYCYNKILQTNLPKDDKENVLNPPNDFITNFIDSWMIVKGDTYKNGVNLEQFLEFGCKVIYSHERMIRGLLNQTNKN
jgi:hypothetical protein